MGRGLSWLKDFLKTGMYLNWVSIAYSVKMGRYSIVHLYHVKHAECVTIPFYILTGSIPSTLVTFFSMISMLSWSGFNTYDHIFALGALWLRVRLCRCTIIASWKLNPIKWRPHRGIPIYDAHRAHINSCILYWLYLCELWWHNFDNTLIKLSHAIKC